MDLSQLDSSFTRLPELEIVGRLLLAAAFGAVIGFDREVKNRAAGLRTHMLIALAAAVFTIITFELYHATRALTQHPTSDPIRIIEAVTAGVAFLAAGAIIQSRGKVEGLTTGAAMWMAGALGVACGAGYIALATIAAVLTYLILSLLKLLERYLPGAEQKPEPPQRPEQSAARK